MSVVHLTRLHSALVLGSVAFYLVSFAQDGLPWVWVALWAAGLALTAWAPFRPEVALGAYAATLYGTPRYADLFDSVAGSNVLHLEAFFAATGTALWLASNGRTTRLNSPLLWLAGALFVWGSASAALAALAGAAGPQSDYAIRHSNLFFVHSLVLLIAASQVMGQQRAARSFTMILSAGLAARVLWQGAAGLRLENDIGPIAAMVLPLCLLLQRSDPSMFVRLSMLGAAGGALATVALTYNRASVVALGAVLLALCWRNRRNPWILGAAAGLLAVTAWWVTTSDYRPRIEAAWKEVTTQGSRGSVAERFALWNIGTAIVRDHPVFGVGPGNYPVELVKVAPQLGSLPAHNNYVQMAAETGIPGVVLYVALFVMALAVTQHRHRLDPGHWTGRTAAAVQISLVAYLAVGFFISRHDMVLAYVLVGWTAALSRET